MCEEGGKEHENIYPVKAANDFSFYKAFY